MLVAVDLVKPESRLGKQRQEVTRVVVGLVIPDLLGWTEPEAERRELEESPAAPRWHVDEADRAGRSDSAQLPQQRDRIPEVLEHGDAVSCLDGGQAVTDENGGFIVEQLAKFFTLHRIQW